MEAEFPFLIKGILLVSFLGLLPLVLHYFLSPPPSSSGNTSSPKKNATTVSLPPSIPLVSILVGLTKFSWPSLSNINFLLHRLHAARGKISALFLPFGTAVFISDTAFAHQVLVSKGSAVSERLPPSSFLRHQGLYWARVTISPYGETWRSLRRNLWSGFSTPSSMMQFTGCRFWAKEKLLERFRLEAATSGGAVNFRSNFSHVSYGLLAAMCYGRKLDDEEIAELKFTIERMISQSIGSIFFAFLPRIVRNMISNRRGAVQKAGILFNLLKSRRDLPFTCYADTLKEFELPQEGDKGGSRKLGEEEIVELCAEFFGAGGHNSTNALEWIMAELVNHRQVQERLAKELCLTIEGEEEKVPYLRAVVMEGLRLHPPSPSFVRHAVEMFEVGGYVVPKGAMVFFNAAAMGKEEKVWKDPLVFRPERFLVADTESKIMSFGEGRRACAGMGLAIHHLSYFVMHLVKEFEWRPITGDEVDMSEKMEFFMYMKTPLRARIIKRS